MGGGLHDSIPGNITRRFLPGIGLHAPLKGRQAQPQFISLHHGVGQMCPSTGFFRAVPSQNGEKFATSPAPPRHSLNDSIVRFYVDDGILVEVSFF